MGVVGGHGLVDREIACQELDKIERTLSEMSAWVDGGTPDRKKASIMLEDAARAVAAAAWTIQRDPVRVASQVHRRLPPPDAT